MDRVVGSGSAVAAEDCCQAPNGGCVSNLPFNFEDLCYIFLVQWGHNQENSPSPRGGLVGITGVLRCNGEPPPFFRIPRVCTAHSFILAVGCFFS